MPVNVLSFEYGLAIRRVETRPGPNLLARQTTSVETSANHEKNLPLTMRKGEAESSSTL